MPQTISEFIGVSPVVFKDTGAFDAILEIDSRFYIEPLLLKSTEAAESKNSFTHLLDKFGNILKLLALSSTRGDRMWREAASILSTRELKGLCIGYSAGGTGGSGMGPKYRAKLLNTAKQIVDAGINDPSIFMLVGLLEEGVGCDRISDMIARMIAQDIFSYSERIFKQLGVKTRKFTYGDQSYQIPLNPHNRWPILLIPRDVLRPLPIARSQDEISMVCDYNRRVRSRINAFIGGKWGKTAVSAKKRAIRNALLSREDILKSFLEDYLGSPPPYYDFEKDPVGDVIWLSETKRLAIQNPLALLLPSNPKPADVVALVLVICERFKALVENNGLHDLLYEGKGKGKPKHESAAQLIFYGIADTYCRANNLDLSAEVNAGRGAVDFKFSRGYTLKVVVEVKLTTNSRVKHGLTTQLTEYQKAENTDQAVFIVIHVVGGVALRATGASKIVATAKAEGKPTPEIVVINAVPKPSASKPQKQIK